MTAVDCLVVKRRRLSLKSACFLRGHGSYRFTGGINLYWLASLIPLRRCMFKERGGLEIV